MTKAIENAATIVQLKIWPKFETFRWLVLFTCTVLVAGKHKTCKATHILGESSARISCYFDTDLLQRQNVFMEHLRVNASDHEIVASCQLTSGRYACRCIDGYRVVGNITNVLTVEIISVLPEHAGIYWCGGFEPHPLERIKCKLSVKDKINEDSLPTSSAVVIAAVAMLRLVTCFVVNRLSTDVY